MDELWIVKLVAQCPGKEFFQWITFSATYLVILLIIAIVCWKDREKAAKMLISLGISLFSVAILKQVFARPRPCMFEHMICPSSFSFPSDHASRVLVLTYYEPILLPWAILVSFSRIVLFQHFPSDVIFGACWGIFCSIIGEIIWEGGKAFYKKKR